LCPEHAQGLQLHGFRLSILLREKSTLSLTQLPQKFAFHPSTIKPGMESPRLSKPFVLPPSMVLHCFSKFFYTFSLFSVNLGSKRGSKIIKIGIVVVEDKAKKKSDFANF